MKINQNTSLGLLTLALSILALSACSQPNETEKTDPVSQTTTHSTQDNQPSDLEKTYAKNIYTKQILPSLTTVNEQANTLQQSIKTLCEQPTDEHYNASKQAWQQTLIAWTKASISNIPSISQPLLRDRQHIYAYPDEQKLTPRNIQATLSSNQPLDLAWAESANIRPIGLVGMEYLLFETTHSANDLKTQPRHCELLNAQAQQLTIDIASYQNMWAGEYGQTFANSKQDFNQKNEVTTLWFNKLLQLNQLMLTQKLGLQFDNNDKTKPLVKQSNQHFESQYAHISADLLKADFMTLKQGLVGDQSQGIIGLTDYLRDVSTHQSNQPQAEAQKELASTIDSLVDTAQKNFNNITSHDLAKLTDTEQQALYHSLHNLEVQLLNIPKLLGIYITFNEGDGD